MGLIGFLMAPLSAQLSIDYLTPRDFARRPAQWPNLISRNRGTIAYSPQLQLDMLQETVSEMARNGCKKIILVNGHGGKRALGAEFTQSHTGPPRD